MNANTHAVNAIRPNGVTIRRRPAGDRAGHHPDDGVRPCAGPPVGTAPARPPSPGAAQPKASRMSSEADVEAGTGSPPSCGCGTDGVDTATTAGSIRITA